MRTLGLIVLFLSVGVATASYEEDVVRVNIACQLIKHKLANRVPTSKPGVWHGDLEVLHEWLPNGDCKITCGTSSLVVHPQDGKARVLIDGKLYEFNDAPAVTSQFRPLLGPDHFDDCPS